MRGASGRSANARSSSRVVLLIARFRPGKTRRPDARPAAKRIDLQTRVVRQCREPRARGRVVCLEQRIVLEGVPGLGHAAYAQRRLQHQFKAARCEQRRELALLAGVRGRQHDFHDSRRGA